MNKLFSRTRAPTALGVLAVTRVGACTAVERRRRRPCLAGRIYLIDCTAAVTHVDVDDTIRQTYGYAKQGSGYGHSGVKGLNALLAVSSEQRAPLTLATRLRKGSANSARGAARLVADSLKITRVCGR